MLTVVVGALFCTTCVKNSDIKANAVRFIDVILLLVYNPFYCLFFIVN